MESFQKLAPGPGLGPDPDPGLGLGPGPGPGPSPSLDLALCPGHGPDLCPGLFPAPSPGCQRLCVGSGLGLALGCDLLLRQLIHLVKDIHAAQLTVGRRS